MAWCCAVACVPVLGLAFALAGVGGVYGRFPWYVLAVFDALQLFLALFLPVLQSGGGRLAGALVAGMGTIGGVMSTLSVGTAVAVTYALRTMEIVQAEVLYTTGGGYRGLLPAAGVRMPDGSERMLFGSTSQDEGELVDVGVDPTGDHWPMLDPTRFDVGGEIFLALVGLGILAFFTAAMLVYVLKPRPTEEEAAE